jgi:tight adherence protein B
VIIPVLAGLTVFGIILGTGLVLQTSRSTQATLHTLQAEWGGRVSRPSPLATLRAAFERTGPGRRLQTRLTGFGLTLPALDVTAGLLLGWVFVLLAGQRLLQLTTLPALLIATGAIWAGVHLVLQSRRDWLIRAFNDQMTGVAWLMGNAMRAGMTIPQGLLLLAREAPEPARLIFQRLADEMTLNRPLVQVLEESQARWAASREYRLFILTILIQHRAGGNLAAALDELSRTLTERKSVNEEVRTATAGSRASASVLPLMPMIAAGIMNFAIPGFLNPLFSLWGMVVLIPATFFMWIASVAIQRVARIEV